MRAQVWLDVLRGEYLETFIAAGGASVKFLVPATREDGCAIVGELRSMASALNYQFAHLDAASTKLHLADRLFGALAQQVDWDDLARGFVRQLVTARGLRLPPGEELHIRQLAAANPTPEALLRNELRRAIEGDIFHDYAMAQEFRLAMIQLCLAQLDPDEDPSLREAVHQWLWGELRLVSAVKRALIFQKIARHNALAELLSLAHWLRRAGRSGLILVLDVARYAQAVRLVERGEGLYYSLPATLDLYEVLRQLIDACDQLEGCLVAVLAAPEFLTEDRRGLRGYQALYFRVADEVHDRFQENPLAPLVRIGQGQ